IIPINASLLLRGDGMIARELRSIVRGFDVPLIFEAPSMSEEERASIQELRLHVLATEKINQVVLKPQYVALFPLFPQLKVLGGAAKEAFWATSFDFASLVKMTNELKQQPLFKKIQLVGFYPQAGQSWVRAAIQIDAAALDAIKEGIPLLFDAPFTIEYDAGFWWEKSREKMKANVRSFDIEALKKKIETSPVFRLYQCGTVKSTDTGFVIACSRREDRDLFEQPAQVSNSASSSTSGSASSVSSSSRST
ncbi:MAG TPA: hypothetical protein VN457_01310, partial [Chlamydiales bacterium]|nr:hypothetical protein [Chlamydiales bacterium]